MEVQKGPGKVVTTRYGDLRGVVENGEILAWYGVPYARPPVGDLRWRPPVAPGTWRGVRDAAAYGDQAAQDPAYKSYGLGGMSEDCLYLNILAPRQARDLPVMVWLHGSAFMMLSANMKSYNNPAAIPGIIQWHPFTRTGERYLEIGSPPEMRSGLAEGFGRSSLT